jgi:hypothetical protein
MAPKLKKRSPPGQRASRWILHGCFIQISHTPELQHTEKHGSRTACDKTSDQHLLVQRFAPMQNFHTLAQPASPEGVGLHQLMDTFFGLGLHDPQGTLGHLPKLPATRTCS